MEIRTNPEAMALGLYQSGIAIIGFLIFAILTWRAFKAFNNRAKMQGQVAGADIVSLAWPPVLWLVLMLIGGLFFSTMQAYGPRVAIEKTELTVNPTEAPAGGVQDISPSKLTDEERLKQQRALEAETKQRVNLQDK